MEFNVIAMCLDVKLDIYDKRPDSLKFKTWTKCQVKIEAIKCLPCFLRVNIESLPDNDESGEAAHLSLSINVPGVTISLATSRTKQFTYGMFWTHNRRDCFIYFALDTEVNLRKHMKWIKKSIKNLELYRQVFLEQRRNSRGPGLYGETNKKMDATKELRAVKDALKALGPLPQIPTDANSSINWSRRVSRASDIYEEIYEGNTQPPRLSRRLSRGSIASGIYEEMKLCTPNIQSIIEEHSECPPPIPPLPPHRKRLNTFETDPFAILGDIPRSSTNPESELVKKKYKNVLGTLFGASRAKRAESVSETPTCTMEDIINGENNQTQFQLIYANDVLKPLPLSCTKIDKRNSFSSPDLSKINFLDTFDEEKIVALMQLNSSSDLEAHVEDDFVDEESKVLNYSSLSLDDSAIATRTSILAVARIRSLKLKSGSMESFNVSSRLPQNFNFSACNTSSINLVGASGAVPSAQNLKRNKIILDDELTGYCIMAPIRSKNSIETQEATTTTTSSTSSSTTSGYYTGSYCSSSTTSSTSSNIQAVENIQKQDLIKKTLAITEADYDQLPVRKAPLPVADNDLGNIYENMQSVSPLSGNSVVLRNHENTPPLSKEFTGNLYENLLTIKAAQELEQPLPANVCTSTPTDSPADEPSLSGSDEQESYYQTPRKSIISVDDKIPSYYPNSCDTVKMRRRSNSPNSKSTTPTTHKAMEKEKSSNSMGLKRLVNIKMKRERKENLYISSPQKIMEQRIKSSSNASPLIRNKKSANAHKIADNVYAVNLTNKKSLQLNNNTTQHNNNNNMDRTPYNKSNDTAQLKEKLHNELLQLALQNIDFKFDDTSCTSKKSASAVATSLSLMNTSPRQTQSGIAKLEQAELEYENCYQATRDATRLLHKYATLAPKQSMRIKQQLQQHLQNSQGSNQKILMTQSTKLESPVSSTELTGNNALTLGSKKFASLPRFKKIDFSPLKLKINNVLQRNHAPDF